MAKKYRETDISYSFNDGDSLDQSDLAILGSCLVRDYPGWDASAEERDAHLAAAARTSLTSMSVAKAVGMWVGVYIDECHDQDAEKCGGYAAHKDMGAIEWMEWAYDMLTDGAILRLNNG